MIRKLTTFGTSLAMLALSVSPAFASSDHLHLQWHKEVNRKQCDVEGKAVINVTQKIVNDVDSGEAGNYWAFDKITRRIKVWPTGTDTYCANVSYEGKFDAVPGQVGPGGTGIIGPFVQGNFNGGYRTTEFSGTLKSSPLWPTNGSVGTTDYQCDLSGNCPGAITWTDQYFDGLSGFDLDWWGWQYHTAKHGDWINSIDGNQGNIL